MLLSTDGLVGGWPHITDIVTRFCRKRCRGLCCSPMRTILFTLLSIISTVALSATVYKWVDQDGVVHYSDQPHENAQKVELKAPQTYSAQKGPNLPASAGKTATKSAAVYQVCAIASPSDEQVFMNTTTITAGVNVQPAVRPGDQAVVTMDGQRVPGVPPFGGQFTISPVDRGTHSLRLVVQDVQGNAVCQSSSVTFHVHQPSMQNPNNATTAIKPH
jgi:hypothetical protein